MRSLKEQLYCVIRMNKECERDFLRDYARKMEREDGRRGYDSATVDRKLRELTNEGRIFSVEQDGFITGYTTKDPRETKPKKTDVPLTDHTARLFPL